MFCFSEACEHNKGPILEVLQSVLPDTGDVLEIGSGTGQHAIWMAQHLPAQIWHSSDRPNQPESFAGLKQNISAAGLANLRGPYALDVAGTWPELRVDALFTANTLHIMSESDVICLFQGARRLLNQGLLCVYGPFNQNGQFTSPGNASLDEWVKSHFPFGGIKDLAWISAQAQNEGFKLHLNLSLPANNRMLIFSR